MKILKKFLRYQYRNDIAIKLEKKSISYNDLFLEIKKISKIINKYKINKLIIMEGNDNETYHYSAMLASLINGITYIPINSSTPKSRLLKIYKLSKADAIITGDHKIKSNSLRVIKFYSEDFQKQKLFKLKIKNNFKPAYIIFTSGSTGTPKGVIIMRDSLKNYLEWILSKFYNNKKVVSTQLSNIGFDLSVADIYGTFFSMGTLVPLKNVYNISKIRIKIIKHNITHIVCVPSLAQLIFIGNEKKYFKNLKKILFCGEILKKYTVKKIFSYNKNIIILNTYGPTEATVSCTMKTLNYKNYHKFSNPSVSFGKAIRNMNIYIDKPKNNVGELIISGVQIANGYLNEKYNNKFFKKNKNFFFRTGDICKKLNQDFYFVCRKDRQIKKNGYRIELEEIDKHISEAANAFCYSIYFKKKIFSFIEEKKLDKIKLLKKLQYNLPNYMIPDKFIKLAKMQRNINNKINEQKLKFYINEKY